MPTLTFYADDATAKKLKKVLLHKTKELGFKVSRGAFISQHIQQVFDEITADNGSKPAPVEAGKEPK